VKKIYAMVFITILLATSCTDSASQSPMQSLFSDVPAELATTSILWFNNMEKMKELTNEGPDKEPIDYIRGDTEEEKILIENIFGGLSTSVYNSHAAFSYGAFDMNTEVWAEAKVLPNSTNPLFSIARGNFNAELIIDELSNQGFTIAEYDSNKYYTNENGGFTPGIPLTEVMYITKMVVSNEQIIAAASENELFPILDTQSEQKTTIENLPAYTTTSSALGNVLGAALIPKSQLICEYVNEDWNRLHDYDLVGIGYFFQEDLPSIYITIFYPDDSAKKDVDELRRRLSEYEVSIEGLSSKQLSGLFDIGYPEVIDYESGSVLKTELTYKTDTPRFLWVALILTCDLGFLVVDPSQEQ